MYSLAKSTAKEYPTGRDRIAGLLAQLASGELNAMSELYELTNASVYAVALSILKNPHDAEDVLQETYVKLYNEAASYRPTGSALAWILTIARNLCLMKLRRDARTDLTPDEELDKLFVEGHADQSDDRMYIAAALMLLSTEEAEVITLHATSGMVHREIAALLGLPLSTVLSRYNRGLKKLKSYLEDANE